MLFRFATAPRPRGSSMKIKTYVLVGMFSVSVFTLNQLPAHLVWQVIGPQVAPMIPFTVEGVGGSLWDGFVVGRPQAGLTDRVVARWNLKPGALLLGRVAAELGVESAGFKIRGTAYAGMSAKGAYDVSAAADASFLNPFLQGMSASASGQLTIDGLAVALNSDFKVTEAAGTLNWKGGSVTADIGSGPQQYTVPPVMGEISQRFNGAFVDLKQVDGNKALGEVGITGDGILSVTALQRVMTLVGMTAGDEDKVLIKTQQPLF